MSLVDQDLRTIPEHMSSPPVLIDVSVAQSLGLCVNTLNKKYSLIYTYMLTNKMHI
jgi:hypothetical protein